MRHVNVTNAFLLLAMVCAACWQLLPRHESGPASPRASSLDNLKNIVTAVHAYHGRGGTLPVAATWSRESPPMALHGWQTWLLPDVDSRALFDRIDKSRSWDNPANRPYFQQRVGDYLNPHFTDMNDSDGWGLSHYTANSRVVVDGAPFRLDQVTDGLATTILFGEISENLPPWGRPHNVRDPAAGLNAGPQTFGGPWPDGSTQVSFVDGRVKLLNADIDPAVLRALATPAGGESVTLP
jgi:hypothetical protein